MRRNNGKRLVIISILLIIVAILVFIGLYFTTDLLKSEKQLFFKYAMQLGEDSNNTLVQYLEKKEKAPYKNEGNITCNVILPEESLKEQVEQANNINISFKGNVYNSQQKREQEITLNYDENVNFPVVFKQSGDYFGIQTDYISPKYIAIENNDLPELCKKLGMTDTSNIPNKIDFQKSNTIKFTDEEKEILKQRYKEVLEEQLTERMFSKSQNTESTIYVLELTPDDTKNIIKQLLERLKTDDIILPRINELVEQEVMEEDFNQIVENIDELELEENIKIQVYVKEKECNKILVQTGTKTSIILEKEQNNNSAQYDITLTETGEETVTSIQFKMQYIGLQKLDDITEVFTISIENTVDEEITSYIYDIENKVSFDVDTTIEELNENNAVILNNKSENAITNFMEAVGSRITEVNKNQMEELGVETNPLMYTNPVTVQVALFSNIINNRILMQNQTEQEDKEIEQMMDDANKFVSSMETSEKDVFNNQFKIYEGEQKGTEVKALNQVVTSSNAQADNRLVELVVDIGNIKDSKRYNVSISYDRDGYANEIVVEPIE